jgi:hypothetical protein
MDLDADFSPSQFASEHNAQGSRLCRCPDNASPWIMSIETALTTGKGALRHAPVRVIMQLRNPAKLDT